MADLKESDMHNCSALPENMVASSVKTTRSEVYLWVHVLRIPALRFSIVKVLATQDG